MHHKSLRAPTIVDAERYTASTVDHAGSDNALPGRADDPRADGTSIAVQLELDDPLTRAGLTALLTESGVRVVEEFDPDDPVDVVIWDADDAGPPPRTETPLLALTADLDRCAELVAAGAAGVLPRRSGAAQLAAAARALARGLGVLPAPRLRNLIGPAFEAMTELPLEPLTPREREVLGLLADGLTNRSIAERLDIGLSTVKFHLTSLLGKFAAGTRTELVVRAIRSGDILV